MLYWDIQLWLVFLTYLQIDWKKNLRKFINSNLASEKDKDL